MKTSIRDFCQKVKSPVPGTFQLPKVLAVQRSESARRVFAYLYMIADQQGFFELDACQISVQTGLSRKTVYKAIAFLQKVRLLFLHQSRTGRGKHSVYWLNWRKPQKREAVAQKKCHPPTRYRMKLNNIHPSGDRPEAMSGEIISPANRQQWNRCMKAFRETLGNSTLPKGYLRICTALVGRHLKGKTCTYALKLFEKLRGLAHKLRVPGWVKSLGELCRWFMGLLKGLFKAKPRRKRRRFVDTNEYLWWLHSLEVERARLKRAEYEAEGRSVGEVWRDWAARQRQEMEWQRKQADLAREQLRAAVRAGDDRPVSSSAMPS